MMDLKELLNFPLLDRPRGIGHASTSYTTLSWNTGVLRHCGLPAVSSVSRRMSFAEIG